jgi:hypothetical protein
MPAAYLESRLQFLRNQQNGDGGWGYVPAKGSWTEPSFYALLATWHQRDTTWWRKGWETMRSWQQADGSWQPSPGAAEPHWTTALGLTLYSLLGDHGAGFQRAVRWLLAERPFESGATVRLLHFLHVRRNEHDPKYFGWPWIPGTSSWIEPTAHALVALKKAAPHLNNPELAVRIGLAEEMIWLRRCQDGGWNYGNRIVLGEMLPSYPETTALALLGLQGSSDSRLPAAVEYARGLRTDAGQRLARTWLALALRVHGQSGEGEPTEEICTRNVLLTALECLAHPAGNYSLLKRGGAA